MGKIEFGDAAKQQEGHGEILGKTHEGANRIMSKNPQVNNGIAIAHHQKDRQDNLDQGAQTSISITIPS